MTLRKVTRNHRIFPSDEAVYKVIYLAVQNIARQWTMPIRDWKPALNRFAVEFEGAFRDKQAVRRMQFPGLLESGHLMREDKALPVILMETRIDPQKTFYRNIQVGRTSLLWPTA